MGLQRVRQDLATIQIEILISISLMLGSQTGKARVNINILGISELKWTGRGEFNSEDYYIYYCGQETLRRKGVAIIVNKRV